MSAAAASIPSAVYVSLAAGRVAGSAPRLLFCSGILEECCGAGRARDARSAGNRPLWRRYRLLGRYARIAREADDLFDLVIFEVAGVGKDDQLAQQSDGEQLQAHD